MVFLSHLLATVIAVVVVVLIALRPLHDVCWVITLPPSLSLSDSSIYQKMVQTSIVLESFGNAQTRRNHNSSRFGKYFKILFSGSNCIVGGQIEHFLLEQARLGGSCRWLLCVLFVVCCNLLFCLQSDVPASRRAQFPHLLPDVQRLVSLSLSLSLSISLCLSLSLSPVSLTIP